VRKSLKAICFPVRRFEPELNRIVTFPSHRGQSKVSTINRGDDGANLARKIDMFDLSAGNLIGGLVFGSIGFVAFIYGKRMHLWKPMFCGIVLMIYPYFIGDTWMVYAIGVIGTVALFFLR
jgi:hypothetical protein